MRKDANSAQALASGQLALSLLGVLTACVYLLTFGFYAGGPGSHGRTAKELFAWFAVLTLLPLFCAGYTRVLSVDEPSAVRRVVLFGSLLCLIAVFVYPFHSTDVFGYINRGWQQVRYGQNPYVHTVSEIPNWQQDPVIWEHWIYNPDPYGFLFTLLANLLCAVGSGNWALTLLLFKAVNASACALCARIILSAGRALGHARPSLALYAFLWNPLVLMHHVANGHNDILVGCLVALALYAAVKGGEVWVIPLLVAGTLLKFAPALLLLPAFVFVLRRRGWKTALAGCALGILVAVPTALPFVRDWGQFKLEDMRDNASLIDNSFHSLLIHLFENAARLAPRLAGYHAAVDATIKTVLRVGLILFLGGVYAGLRRDFSAERFIEKSVLILFVLICVASSKFNAWYLGMLLPPALMLEERHPLRQLVLLISCAELLSLTFFKQAYMLNYFAMVLVPCWLVYRRTRKSASVETAEAVALPAS